MSAAVEMARFGTSAHVERDVLTELEQWLNEAARRGVLRVLLAQRAAGLDTIDEWSLEELIDSRAFAHTIYTTAVREAHALRESATYGVFGFHPEAPAVPVARFTFRVDVAGSTPTRMPDERGVIAMLMQHADSAERLALGHSLGIVEQYKDLLGVSTTNLLKQLEQAQARINVLEAREREVIELRDQIVSVAADRQIELETIRQKGEMRKAAITGIAKLSEKVVPDIAARLLGASLFPAIGVASASSGDAGAGGVARPSQVANDPGSETQDPSGPLMRMGRLMVDFLQAADLEQLQSLGAVVKPEQQVILIQLVEQYKTFLVLHAAREATTASAAASSPAPVDRASSGAPATES